MVNRRKEKTAPAKRAPRPLARLFGAEQLEALATPANRRYGTAIFERGGVAFISRTALKVEAWVGGLDGSVAEGGSQRRRTRLTSGARGLRWHCTGNPKDHQIFCKHCVALALAVRAKRRVRQQT